jgi:hypothetical protein
MLNGDAHHTEAEELRIRPVALFSKTRTGARIPQMFLTISDEEKPDRPTGPHFRVLVTWPKWVERLVRRFLGGA